MDAPKLPHCDRTEIIKILTDLDIASLKIFLRTHPYVQPGFKIMKTHKM
jgi:hypothetical protein